MNATTVKQSSYRLEGEFLGFIALKYIQVRVGERIVPVKLAKELRGTLERELTKSDRLAVNLEQDLRKFGKLKLKSDETPRPADANASQSSHDDLSWRSAAQGNAHQDSDRIEKLSASGTQMPSSVSSVSSVSSITSQIENKSKGKILVCRKSSCSKRGGKLLYRAFFVDCLLYHKSITSFVLCP